MTGDLLLEHPWALWLARFVFWLLTLHVACVWGRRSAKRRFKAALPSHKHGPVNGCLRCRIDRFFDSVW